MCQDQVTDWTFVGQAIVTLSLALHPVPVHADHARRTALGRCRSPACVGRDVMRAAQTFKLRHIT